MPGRLTMGLYNSYDANRFHEAMRRAIARAAPLAHAFDLNLALFGFPFHDYETKSGERPTPRTPQEVAALIADSTSIGDAGAYLIDLAAKGRLVAHPFPERGWPPQLGTPVLATQDPEASKRIALDTLASRTIEGESFLIVVGLGPRGVPKRVEENTPHHLELTGRNIGLETATAMGVLAGRLASAVDKVHHLRTPRISVDALVVRDEKVLLIKRGRPPQEGAWVLPGGFVDSGERLEAAALRELQEETGLVGREPRMLGIYDAVDRDPRFHNISVVYVVNAQGTPKGGDDAAEARFHDLASLPPLGFDHGRILEDYRRQAALTKRF